MLSNISSQTLKLEPPTATIHLDWDMFTNELEFE